MFQTLEVRWFQANQIPLSILDWFQQLRPPAEPSSARVDYYMRLPGIDTVGIKLREGMLEIKILHNQHGIINLHKRIAGSAQSWCKWSIQLSEDDTFVQAWIRQSPSWLAVHKSRRLRRYVVTATGEAVQISSEVFPVLGCDLELTMLHVDGAPWWSLGLEAFGAEENPLHDLCLVTSQMFSLVPPPALSADESYSYPGWLCRLPACQDSAHDPSLP